MGFSTRVGKYELGRLLGEGTFAKVKLARNIETGKNFAVKIIDKDTVRKNKLMYQVKREISTMKLLKHPNIVHLYEVVASKKKIYLVMEYVSGGELTDRISYLGKITEEESRKYFHQLMDAIEYCHARNVYHRDLKPENLLLDGKGTLKVSDFGLSVLHQKDAILSTTCGSPNYVAPEIIVHENYDGAAADIWSCGVILFEMLAGFSPFDDANIINLYQKICHAEYSFPSWFSFGSRRLIAKILDPRPRSRISIEKIYEDQWFKKDYSNPVKLQDDEDITLDDTHPDSGNVEIILDTQDRLVTQGKCPVFVNAFQLISMSNDLDLSGFFENEDTSKHKKRFGSRHSANDTIEQMEDAVKTLGLRVERINPRKTKIYGAKQLGRSGSYLSVTAQITDVTPSFSVVEIWKSGGDTVEYIELYKSVSSILTDAPENQKIVQVDSLLPEVNNYLTLQSSQEICSTKA
ncbi:hypothetical protein SUGI_0898430 [Cryptomeria japonica]|uniref:CBL-interacting serine/threonine-protein kinase 9 isoform X2 n=1 Tax=Cryptomeria japonica TaxID=3369 RepID=UPI002414CF90|nr:CBL-interacting serine/threonine-protein kinase 9 isoform X2 [Cryptomeria japonica]GLJ43271.1 hypothetical protein SUGI_0898430 [Cryptomeria japonica]